MKKNALTKAVNIALTTLVTGSLFSAVNAQEADATEQASSVERIAVVGSRAAPRSVGESPVPVDIIGGDELGKSGDTDMLELLRSAIPSLNVRTNPINDTATLIRPANLRGLASDHTLILVNGKRRHRASVIAMLGGGINDGAQGPDISVIPSVALKQVEVLRDGAAAQYGSDAIAGVINFVLKDSAEGGSMSVKHGQFYDGDGAGTTVDGNIGLPFSDDGFANFSFQYREADPTSRSVQRPDAAAYAQAGVEGVEDPAQIWGQPEIKDDVTLFGNIGLDLNDTDQFYLFGNYSERDVKGGFYYRNPQTKGGIYTKDGGESLLVGSLNGEACPEVPFTATDITTTEAYQQIAGNDNCFAFTKLLPGGFTPQFAGNIADTSLTMGVKGEIENGALEGSRFDLSGSVGRNESRYYLVNTVNPSMGAETPFDFMVGKHIQLEKTFNADLSKEFDLGFAYEVNVAGGLEWREETFEVLAGDESSYVAGPLAEQGFAVGSNGFPGYGPESAGENVRRNYAAYVDVEVPFTEEFMMQYALRFEDFETFGSTTNYKVTAQLNATDDLSLRGSLSTGFRAPTVGQANLVNTSTKLEETGLVEISMLPPTHQVSQMLGAEELQPEESKSITFGAVYQYEDLFLTVDFYNIEVTDRISKSNEFALTEEQKDVLREDGAKNVDSLSKVTFFTNDFDTTTRGVDVVANYNMGLLDGDATFAFVYNYNETEVDSYTDVTGDFKVSRLENDLPKHRATLTWNQDWDAVSALVRANYYGTYQGVHAQGTLVTEKVDAAFTFDAQATYHFNEAFSATIGAQNLFDTSASRIQGTDSTPANVTGGIYYENSPYGFNGGYYYGKVTYRF